MLAFCLSEVYVFGAADGYSDVDFDKIKVGVGLELLEPTNVGVFHYEQSGSNMEQKSTCSVLSNHSTKVHWHLTDCF